MKPFLGVVPHSLMHIPYHGLFRVFLELIPRWITHSWVLASMRAYAPVGFDVFHFAQFFQQKLISYQIGLTFLFHPGISTSSYQIICK